MTMEMRSVERMTKSDSGTDIFTPGMFQDLKEGDVFRLFEEDGKPVYDQYGASLFVALSDAYVGENSIWTIDIAAAVPEDELQSIKGE